MLRCDVLGTTYRTVAKYFLCTKCVKYATAHRPQTTNHTSTFNSRIRLTLTDHNLTIITQITICCNDFRLKASWTLIKYNLILGHMQHSALLLILYVSSTRLPKIALLSIAGNNAALSPWALLLSSLCNECHCTFVSPNITSWLNTHDERYGGYNFKILFTFRSNYPYSFPLHLRVPRHI